MKSTVERTTVGAYPAQPVTRFPILDALRFVLASWVVIAHFGAFPLFAGVDEHTFLGRLLSHGWSSITFGTPAVIGFFVISGFCIHLPFRNGEELPIGRYYARRYIRILVPLAGGLMIFYLAGIHMDLAGPRSILWHSVLWSLMCEEIYYAIYPLLRILRYRYGWRALLAGSFAGGIIISVSRTDATDWAAYGPLGTSLILLPVWLLGCLLAEQSSHLKPLGSGRTIWWWRFLAWFCSWICEMAHFKGHISFTYTMVPFGVVAYLWIREEIRHGMGGCQPWKLIVSAGAWSYSLYLIHGPAMFLFTERLHHPNLGYILNWCVANGFIFTFAYCFYLLVERPSHRLARKIALHSTATGRMPSGELVFAGGAGSTASKEVR
jgi:peptidoglycan/LPS O-acetylase OafA/YrhL